MAWRHRWLVRLNVLEHGTSDREEPRSFTVESVAELRAAVETARADPLVRRYRFERVHELDHGDEPTRCRCGRALDGGLYVRAERAWVDCRGCPGHILYRCRACAVVLIWPDPTYECRPNRPTIFGP